MRVRLPTIKIPSIVSVHVSVYVRTRKNEYNRVLCYTRVLYVYREEDKLRVALCMQPRLRNVRAILKRVR